METEFKQVKKIPVSWDGHISHVKQYDAVQWPALLYM